MHPSSGIMLKGFRHVLQNSVRYSRYSSEVRIFQKCGKNWQKCEIFTLCAKFSHPVQNFHTWSVFNFGNCTFVYSQQAYACGKQKKQGAFVSFGTYLVFYCLSLEDYSLCENLTTNAKISRRRENFKLQINKCLVLLTPNAKICWPNSFDVL